MKSTRQIQFEQPSPAAVDAQLARDAATVEEPQQIGGASVAWIEQIAGIVRRDGHALRAGQGLWIDAQSINTGVWHPLALEGRRDGDVFFNSKEDRDAVLAEIQRRAARPEHDPLRSCHTHTLQINTVDACKARN